MKVFAARLFLAIEIGVILYACSAIPVAFRLWRGGADSFIYYAVALLIPTFATLVLTLLMVSIPGLLAVRRIGWPLNLSLPPLYFLIAIAVAEVGLVTQSSLVAGPELLRVARTGMEPRLLSQAVVAQACCITLIGTLRRPDKQTA